MSKYSVTLVIRRGYKDIRILATWMLRYLASLPWRMHLMSSSLRPSPAKRRIRTDKQLLTCSGKALWTPYGSMCTHLCAYCIIIWWIFVLQEWCCPLWISYGTKDQTWWTRRDGRHCSCWKRLSSLTDIKFVVVHVHAYDMYVMFGSSCRSWGVSQHAIQTHIEGGSLPHDQVCKGVIHVYVDCSVSHLLSPSLTPLASDPSHWHAHMYTHARTQ